ncbi:20683_t:CDS:1, partial [Dentiscutata erythropus]
QAEQKIRLLRIFHKLKLRIGRKSDILEYLSFSEVKVVRDRKISSPSPSFLNLNQEKLERYGYG